MAPEERTERDLAALIVPAVGRLATTGDPYEPYRLLDAADTVVEPVVYFFRDLLAAGCQPSTSRSYGMDLLRWFRFCWAVEVQWDRAQRVDARDFCLWLQVAGKQPRAHWRTGLFSVPQPPQGYAPSARAHAETVLRGFYQVHLEAGVGPVINPFPLGRARGAVRANAHHNPMEPWRNERAGRYRPRVPTRFPRSIPDRDFDELFAALPSHRDRALVAFYISTGARASELLSVRRCDLDPGRQLVTVVRKGTREVQQLPASPDAFVWLRLYQIEFDDLLPRGARQPLWWTLRRPFRPLGYHAAHRMFERAGAQAGTDATLHALRHTAAYRMAEDPDLPLTDVQHVLGHAQLTTTQIYLTPRKEDVIRRMLAYHARQVAQAEQRRTPQPAPGYRKESLDVLFGSGA